ncbi:putative membrane protein [Rhodococcus wratislaviensis IFP 2016]|nr:putative membrane protein [Rhodococcus wratislaviensis IFP 2016]
MTNEERREPHVGGNSDPVHQGTGSHSRHRWMMIACCIPMLVVAVALIASGTVGIGSLVFALVCLGMMVVMMFSIGGQRH